RRRRRRVVGAARSPRPALIFSNPQTPLQETSMSEPKPNPTRRTLIKGVAAAGGVLGFPFVHAQEKITLRYLGTAVNQDKAIAEKFKADTGITIQYVAVTTDDVTKRAVTAPNSFDLIDT